MVVCQKLGININQRARYHAVYHVQQADVFFVNLCVEIPRWLSYLLHDYGDDRTAIHRVGIVVAMELNYTAKCWKKV